MANLNYFGDREREAQQRFARLRTRVSRPALVWLDRHGFNPTEITLFSALAGLLFGLSVAFSLKLAGVFLALHLLSDSLDGSLARHQKVESDHGAFLDIITDHLPLLTICAVPPVFSKGVEWLFPAYGFTYVLLIALVTYANSAGVRVSLVIRTKYVFFGLAALHVYWPIAKTWLFATDMFLVVNLLMIANAGLCLLRGQVKPRILLFLTLLAPVILFLLAFRGVTSIW